MNTRTDERSARVPGVLALTRDILTFIGGWVVAFMEVARPEARESVLLFAGTLITVPGAFVGAAALASSISRRGGSTPSSPSDPPSSG